MTDTIHFPTREQHARAWEELAQAIAASADSVSQDAPAHPPARPGELTIIGSGIETMGFTIGDEELIRGADAVFFCVADPATVVWLKSIRPDAYDLYVLYDDTKVRYTTYMQMSEAMLHHVRQGKKVVAVYYGHPGIFVLSTHRCIMIARREGHKAVMRPGVCALDCLCADLGVDPCHPGMQTHEATDMLIRGRIPDTSLHVVLWQVGLIGEMGFRRRGYINNNFSVFVEYLQKYYGDDYPVTHYIASRYPTIPPTIEVYPLSALHDPQIQTRVTGVSTFYVPPKNAAAADLDMLIRLGLIQPGQEVRTSDGPLREIGLYGPRERKAFRAFRRFKVSRDYQWQEDTGASRFLIALRSNPALQERYERDPRAAVAPESFPGLTDRERSLLATRDHGAIQIAAKGTGVAHPGNRDFLFQLFDRKPVMRSLLAVLRGVRPETATGALAEWSAGQGLALDWDRMRTDVNGVLRDRLFPWAGVYEVRGETGEDGRLIVLTGDGDRARLFVDGQPVRRFSFRRGILQWKAGAGRADNGFLRVDVDVQGGRRLIGSIWPAGEPVPAEHGLVAVEGRPGHRHPSSLAGRYTRKGAEGPQCLEVGVAETPERGRHLCVTLDGRPLDGAIVVGGRTLSVGDLSFVLGGSADAPTGAWMPEPGLAPLTGSYVVRAADGGLRSLSYAAGGLLLDGQAAGTIDLDGSIVSWSGGPAHCSAGQVTLLLDPITLCPALFGTVETPAGTVRCIGRAAAPTQANRPEPEFGLQAAAWRQLVDLAGRPDGEFLLWHKWEKANLAATVVNTALARLLP
ncbi:SAM-dependent methyltransferase [Azospirillum lipoferum]|uniref:Tetrapyrrole methylase domain-containing protein n=1 Tax=Azospirillum lipoferum (strain 4B) TaxID=862719 RepID=G7ZCF2_AZOL4|nr:SAM-dependent methyltransferase [Azospirillum lipoferum]CBS89320.1 Conserved protein of unknown function [Azospirillum lipoferum 4B]